MLLPESQFSLPQVPDVILFQDDSNPLSFYAVAAHPRIAQDADGSVEFQLMLYGKWSDKHFQASGGVLTFTLSLGLTSDEERDVTMLLKKNLAITADPNQPPPQPVLSGLHWASAQTSLIGPAGMKATTQPSLLGDNRASFNMRLTKEQATLAQEGHLCATVRYDTQLGSPAFPMSFSGDVDLSGPEDRTSRVEL